MKRERLTWMISFVLLAILALRLPGGLAQRDDDYGWVRTLVEVHRQVVNNYVEPVDDSDLKEKAIEGMLSDLDKFTVFIPPTEQEQFDRMLDGNFKGVGITLDMRPDGKAEVITPIDGSPAFHAGVMAGDIILKVNGESIEGLKLPDVVKKIAGPLGSPVSLTVQHTTGETADLTMVREEIVVPTVKGYQRKLDDTWDYFACPNPKIGYIRITQFNPDTYDELTKVLVGVSPEPGKPGITGLLDQGMKGLILDLRFNPGGRLDQATKVVNMFVKEGVIVSTKGRARPETIVRATGEGTLPNFPLIVLVNEHSASAAKIVSGSLKDNRRALIVGQRTYGKGSVQELIPLDSNGGELKLTVAYYYLPSGRLVHRKKDAKDWGVEPQIIVPTDEVAEREILQQYLDQDTIRRPMAKSVTQPATQMSATMPATQPVDMQMQQAVNTMVGLIVLQGSQSPESANAIPSTQPATVP